MNRKIRVVHVVNQLATGGMEKLLLEFARHADRRYFDLRFISLTTRGCLADDLEALEWPVTALDVQSGISARLLLALWREFRKWDLDVVHAHNTRSLIYAGPTARLARVPSVIMTRHGQGPGPGRRFMLLRGSSAFADRVVCVSRDSQEVAIRRGMPPQKLMTILNGIDLSKFAFCGPRHAGPVVMVGRLSPEKDVGTLVRAAGLAIRDRPSFRLEIAGDGVCRHDLEALTLELGLGSNVRFLGEVRDIPALLARASAFVLSSRTEGISLTLLEAMARGLPVVATRVGGNPEVVADGQTGWLVPAGSASEMAKALLTVTKEQETAVRLGTAGRERVETYFDVRRMVASYENLYQDLNSRRRTRSEVDRRPTAISEA